MFLNKGYLLNSISADYLETVLSKDLKVISLTGLKVISLTVSLSLDWNLPI